MESAKMARSTGEAKADSGSSRGKGRPFQQDSEDTLRGLYRVAYKHFLMHGIEGASIQAIAKEAGVTRQTIYNRFGSKEQLFQAVIREGDSRKTESFVKDPHLQSDDPVFLFNYLGNLLYEFYTAEDKLQIFQVLDSALARHPEIASRHTRSVNQAYKIVKKYIQRCSAEIPNDIDDSNGAVRDFFSIIYGAALPVIQGREKVLKGSKRKNEINAIVLRYLRGIGFTDL
ncbi:TetR/AcrR family transcriptional regulator [Spongiibacter sp. KMU-166]|uniref:TetR/AcrR family transcriptional regulator n=1 Tax=Spongiibacter thalassae TaxID=2721624 RepID=A0ABX1GBB3_9GAMM|nr:TetR/AcrR family transcriptional regulator [Spongiibacter thalassae]